MDGIKRMRAIARDYMPDCPFCMVKNFLSQALSQAQLSGMWMTLAAESETGPCSVAYSTSYIEMEQSTNH
jgi:hypothetical protein